MKVLSHDIIFSFDKNIIWKSKSVLSLHEEFLKRKLK